MSIPDLLRTSPVESPISSPRSDTGSQIENRIVGPYGIVEELLHDEDDDYRSNAIHYLILKGSTEELEAYLNAKTDEEEKQFLINNPDTKTGLCPIHLTAMMNSIEMMVCLMNTRLCNPDAQDFAGATACHHAAVHGNVDFIAFLTSHGASPEVKDKSGGTYHHVLQQIYPQNDGQEQIFYYHSPESPEGSFVKQTGQDFFELTGARFLDRELIVPQADWIRSWKALAERSSYENFDLPDWMVEMQAKYQTFKMSPPNVYLDHDQRVGYFVRAGEDIPRFSIIGEYLGQVMNREMYKDSIKFYGNLVKQVKAKNYEEDFRFVPHPPTEYYMGMEADVIDAYEYRGMMGMVVSSFPNVMVRQVIACDGREERALFIAMDDIKQGDILAYDYGNHAVKRMPYCELRLNELRAFFQGMTKETLLAALIEPDTYSENLNERLNQITVEAKVKYILHTPAALLQLILEDIITKEIVDDLFEKERKLRSPKIFSIYLQAPCCWQEDWFVNVINLWDVFSENESKSDLITQTKQELLTKLETTSALDLYRLLDQLQETFEIT